MKRIKRLQNLPDTTVYDTLKSPVGVLTILASPQGLHSILWEGESENEACITLLTTFQPSPRQHVILETKKQLNEYFHEKRKSFDLPLMIHGTPFQKQAWQQLRTIPYGKTISYAEQAEKVGNKNKARAVGLANGLNPISIIIPCHRVIGSNGKMTGFGGGIEKKEYLLQLEKKVLNQ